MSHGRWAVVLGASSGFGAAVARAMGREGWPVLGVHLDRRTTQERADAVKADVEACGVPAVFLNANATREATRQHALEQLAEHDAEVGLVFHSLAFGSLGPMVGPDHLTERQHAMTLEVMASSLVPWVHDLWSAGRLRGGGRVLVMTSAGSGHVLPGYGAVAAAKAALEAYVRQLAVELASEFVTVNALCAGLARTPALEAIPGWEGLAAAAEARNPSGRLTRPEDVADLVRALVRPETHWLTGSVLRVDGGESLAVAERAQG